MKAPKDMLMNKYLTPTSVNDLDYIAPKLRQADKNECLAATGKAPQNSRGFIFKFIPYYHAMCLC
jgi:hypothetical protein